MAKLTLSLGSNVGNRADSLESARQLIESELGRLVYTSQVISTPAWGLTDQSEFLNQVVVVAVAEPGVEVGTYLVSILDHLQEIERRLGRERRLHWGPRTIDIDMVFLDDLHYESERISLPHPWWHRRSFVTDQLPVGIVHDGYFGILNGRE